jgi:hypothetical protein
LHNNNKFRGPTGWLLRSLFLEEYVYGYGDIREARRDLKDRVLFTLKDTDVTSDGITYPSLYRLYMEASDPTEYEFAMTHLGGWDHWLRLSEAQWFQPYVERWRTELELKLKARAIQDIIREAEAGTKNSFSANKWLVAKAWAPDKTRRGRPSKAEVLSQAAQIASNNDRVEEDAKRLEIN